MAGQLIFVRNQKPAEIVKEVVDRSLDKYTIENLSSSEIGSGKLAISELLKDYPEFTSNKFIMEFSPNLDRKNVKKVSGMINQPKGEEKYPLVIMIRGFVPSDQYFIGNGTYNSSLFFARNGFITIAPDFLGYGESDKETDNVFEARFQTWTTVLSLLKSVDQIPNWNKKDIFVWGHSNGGQIALTALEITGESYPTVLWAPVSITFPYSILYFTYDIDDHGKALRRELATFENIYDTEKYSLTNYLEKVNAPIQLNQGTFDDAVPTAWSDLLNQTIKDKDKEVIYNLYPGAGHNMEPSWNVVIQKDLEFFKKNLKN